MSTASAPAAPAIVNGVNVTAWFETIDAVKANAELANFNFRAKNAWIGGDRNRTTIKEFTGALGEHRTGVQAFIVDNGEPEILFGDDDAPNPVEWLLHALLGCLATTTAYHGAARNIVIEAIDSEIEGDLDLRGFLGLSDDVRKGYSSLRVRMRVKTKAPPQTIEEITRMSPVYDVLSRSAPVKISIETY